MKEVVADLTLENRLLKKSLTAALVSTAYIPRRSPHLGKDQPNQWPVITPPRSSTIAAAPLAHFCTAAYKSWRSAVANVATVISCIGVFRTPAASAP